MHPGRPLAENFLYPKRVISNCVFNFNFLAVVLSEILGGTKFTLGGVVCPGCPSRKIFVPEASGLLYLMAFLITTFWPLNAGLTEHSP